MVQHFVLKRGHHHGELSSVFDTAGVILSGAAAVGGCVATAGIPCVIAGVAGGLGAINSTNHLYGDVQQAWTGKAHSTALSSAAIALGASSSDAAHYQRYADMATAVSSVFDLGLGAASLVKLTRVGDKFSSVAAGRQTENLNSSFIRSNTVHATQTIDLNAVNDASGTALANVGTVAKSSDIVRDIPQGELKYLGVERLPGGTAKVGDGFTKGADDTVDLYRAVAPVEFDDIAKTGTLNLGPSAFGKQFGYSFDEILKLSDHLPDTGAIMKVKVPKNALNGLDHTPVDRHILRSGSLTVQPEKLDQFNKAVQSIEHVY